jgi:CheY-like chemotaxis protein
MIRFLLINDDDIISVIHPATIQRAISDSDIEITPSGTEALALIDELIHYGESAPNYIFLDINMPEISGFEFLDLLTDVEREFLKDSKIIMLSSSVNQQDIERAKTYPMIRDFVSKPLTVEYIRDLVGLPN